MSQTLYTQNGIIRFYDGTVIAIEQQEYSPDGLYNWEKIFNPNDHLSSLDGVTPIAGHKYKRVMHSGDTAWQMPYKIVAETPEFRVTETEPKALEWKFEDETTWEHLFYLTDVKGDDGEQGEQGIPGEGFHIDLYGFYQARPACSESLASSCNTCNPGSSVSGQATTFMSLGDGVLVLTQALITAGTVTVDTVAYSHFSNDLVTWTALTAGIVDFEARYLATDGTGAVYTDMRTEDYYSTRGTVYVCAEGNWTVLNNIATPSYMVGEAVASSNIGFLDNFVTASVNALAGSITLNAGLFEVIEQSLTENALIQTMFGDGIEILTPMAKPQVAPVDFAGFGLSTYTSDTDSLVDIQVNASDLLGDGIAAQVAVAVDGETRNLFQVDVTDLVNNDSGITTGVQGDGFSDFIVNLGLGLKLDGAAPQAITLNNDPNTITVDVTNVRLTPYAGASTGVSLTHLNPDIIWTNRGLALDTVNGLTTRVDGATIGWDGTGQLEVPLNGLTGDRLNDDVANNAEGIEVLNDMLRVKVDGITIGYDGSGQLEYIGLAGAVVSSITAGGTLVRDDIVYNVTSANNSIDVGLTATVNVGSDTIDLVLDVDEAWLAAYLIANPPVVAATAWGSIAAGTGVASQTDLVAYITGLGHIVEDTYYNNIKINSASGLVIKASDDSEWRLIVDGNGNLDTEAVV